MGLLTKRTVLTAKVESTYNTDPTPAGSDAVLVQNLQINFPAEVLDRPVLTTSISSFAHIQGRKYGELTFDVELKGSGSAGTAPEYDPLIEACGFLGVNSGGVSEIYLPASASLKSCTIWVYRDGLLYKFTGCRGNVEFDFPAGQVAMMHYTFMGHCQDPTDVALVAATLDASVPVPVRSTSFTINSYAAKISSLRLNMNNVVTLTDSVTETDSYGQFYIVDRAPAGEMDPDAELIATKDYWSEWEDDTQMALSIVLTGSAGNIVTFTAPKILWSQLSETDKSGVYGYSLPFQAARNSGDDEVSIALT